MGFTATMLRQAKTLPEQAATLRAAFPTKTAVVAHNCGSDKACLDRSLRHHSLAHFDDIYWLCSMKLARKLFPEMGLKTSLGAMCDRLKIEYSDENTHRAAEDTRLVAALWFALLAIVRSDHPSITTLRHLVDFCERKGRRAKENGRVLSSAKLRNAITDVITSFLGEGLYSHNLSDSDLLIEVGKKGEFLPCILNGNKDGPQHRLVALAGAFANADRSRVLNVTC
jgi:DNA polymerase III epsilon subunit-like protein